MDNNKLNYRAEPYLDKEQGLLEYVSRRYTLELKENKK